MTDRHERSHVSQHAFGFLNARQREGVTVCSRRGMLKASVAGMAGITLPDLLRHQAQGGSAGSNKSVILLWMAGGPSHIDMWDVKPDAPDGIRGPFGTIETAIPGFRLCEHLPKQAALMGKVTMIRSIDCRYSNHQPNQVIQTGNLEAAPRVNREGAMYPAIASVVAKHRGANKPGMPPAVSLNVLDKTHFAWGGWLGKQYDPFVGDNVDKLLQMPAGVSLKDMHDRQTLLERFDAIRGALDLTGSMEAMDRFGQQAVEMILGRNAQRAFDLSREPIAVRDRYGEHAWAQKALLARRLVESGVSFVTIDLSNHRASGTWDTHGDNIPPYGGIKNGLGPLLPVFDHVYSTLIEDLDQRGLLDDVLVLAMGEFGRTPKIGTQGSTDGRNHWPVVMSAAVAGGGMRHGQIIGETERDAGQIKSRPVTPGDLAATIYKHMGVPLDTTYEDTRGRPRFVVENGQPIAELFA